MKKFIVLFLILFSSYSYGQTVYGQTNCELWYVVGNAGNTITSGAVETLINLAPGSAYSWDPTQATPANRPTYNATGYNGHPTMEFDGTNDVLHATSTGDTLAGPITVYILFDPVTHSYTERLLSAHHSSGFHILKGAAAGRIDGNDGTSFRGLDLYGYGEFSILAMVDSGGSSAAFKYGGTYDDNLISGGADGYPSGIAIGVNWNNGSNAQIADVKIAEIVVYSGSHNEAAMTEVFGFLVAAYPLVASGYDQRFNRFQQNASTDSRAKRFKKAW